MKKHWELSCVFYVWGALLIDRSREFLGKAKAYTLMNTCTWNIDDKIVSGEQKANNHLLLDISANP